MRVLVLGGTVFVGHALAAEAVGRGHEVTCAARGESGHLPAGATLVRVDRDDETGLAPLAGERFDAVIDVARISFPWVRRALAALAPTTRHWTFVSTISVYADHTTIGQRPGAPVLPPLEEQVGTDEPVGDPDRYGAIKVASENAVRDAMGERAFVVRPGLITGEGDPTDRFGYWPARMARGGRVVVPDTPDQLVQYIDVRDFARWVLDAAEQGLAGTYDAIGQPGPLLDLLAGIADTVGAEVDLVPIAPAALEAAGVEPWSGRRSLPLWLPETHRGMAAHDPTPCLAAGLRPRPLPDAVSGALAHERALGLDRVRRAGLSPAEEADILGRV